MLSGSFEFKIALLHHTRVLMNHFKAYVHRAVQTQFTNVAQLVGVLLLSSILDNSVEGSANSNIRNGQLQRICSVLGTG